MSVSPWQLVDFILFFSLKILKLIRLIFIENKKRTHTHALHIRDATSWRKVEAESAYCVIDIFAAMSIFRLAYSEETCKLHK